MNSAIDDACWVIIGAFIGVSAMSYLLLHALLPENQTIFTQLKLLFLHGPVGFSRTWEDYFYRLLNPVCPLEHVTSQEPIKESPPSTPPPDPAPQPKHSLNLYVGDDLE